MVLVHELFVVFNFVVQESHTTGKTFNFSVKPKSNGGRHYELDSCMDERWSSHFSSSQKGVYTTFPGRTIKTTNFFAKGMVPTRPSLAEHLERVWTQAETCLALVENFTRSYGKGIAVFRFLHVPTPDGKNCLLRFYCRGSRAWAQVLGSSARSARLLRSTNHDSASVLVVAVVSPCGAYPSDVVTEARLYSMDTHRQVLREPKFQKQTLQGDLRRRRPRSHV